MVLDDYHAIDSEGVYRIVSFLLENSPDSAHLVLSIRVDLALPPSKLRARRQIG